MGQSVIGRTGQWWKVIGGVAALVFGSIAPVFASTGITLTTGTIIAVVGYGLSVALTRCPACGEHWFWKALTDASLYKPLFTQPACPACSHDFSGEPE